MKIARFRLLAAFALLPLHASAVINPPAGDDPPFTAKELAQGYRDNVILARPLPAHLAAADAAEASEGIRVREKLRHLRDLRIIELEAGDDPAAAVERLRSTGRYEFVELDLLRHVAVEPNDPQFANGGLWALKNTGQANGVAGADIKAPAAWDLQREAPGVIVAVVDTGVNLAHQDIATNLWQNPAPTFGDVNGARFLNNSQSGNPQDDNGHGTHVAGTIGALGDNNLGTAGIAWRVQIMAVKVFSSSGTGSNSDIARGVEYAVARGAHIINASYGGLGNTTFTNTELAAITAARDAGIIFVAAAGNDAANMDVSRFYPANHALDNIVTVGNSTRRDELSPTSNFGSAVDLFAPGTDIVSLSHATVNGTATLSGTSMAAPHVSGALALLKARFPNDIYRQLINRLLRGADPGERFASKAHTGGRLNLLAALSTATNRPFNDDFASRAKLASDNLALRSSNAGATAETGEPVHAGAAAATLWWEWTAPTTSLVSVDTSGSAYDTVVAVYTGSALGALTLVAANDDDPGKSTSRATFTAQAGTAYQIAVDGKNGGTGLTLVNVGTTPVNDAFATPTVLAGESLHLAGTNFRATLEQGEPRIGSFNGGTSLWYRWTAPRTGRFQVSAASEDFNPILAVYTGSALGALALVDAAGNAAANARSNGAVWTVEAVAGTSYIIQVDTKNPGAVGQFVLSLTDSRWQFQAGQAITGAPAVGRDGTIYFASTDRSIYALTPHGAQKWTYPTGNSIDTASPAVADDGTVYVGSNDGTLYALTPEGTLKWTHAFGFANPVSNSPAVAADGTIYVKPADGYLYALAPANGATKWRYDVNAFETYASPAIAPDGTVYQGSDDGKLYALNPDGTLKWSFTGDNDIYTVPAIDAAGNLYFSVLNTGKLFSVAPNGTQRWAYAGASLGSTSSPVLSPDGTTVYFGGYDRRLHAVNAATGTARWTHLLADEVRASSPAVDAAGVVYIGAYDYRLYAINPDGTLKRTYDTGNWIRSSPALFGNSLYLGSNDRKLYAFDLAAGAGAGPWPQYRHNARRTGRAAAESLAIAAGPQSQVAIVGLALTLSVSATGEGPLSYQWFKDGAAIAGATSPTYHVATVTAATAGSYTVMVTGPQGSLTSSPAVVTTEPMTPGRLTNLSVRTTAGLGAETLAVGFVIRGGQPKPLLVRGIGPALVPLGVPDALADPRLQVLAESGAVIAANDNWGGGAELGDAFDRVGAFSLPTASKDAATLTRLNEGNYTAQVIGVNDTTGIALAELYDPEPTTAQAGSVSRLVNVSARAQVGSGGSILIAGFTLSGNIPRQVLIRGIGPALGDFNVAGALTNPRLEIYRESTRIHENDDWAGASTLAAAFEQVKAFRLTNPFSRDAVLLVTLSPGGYTAQLSGVNGTTGVGLIEVYEMP